ncbi:DUF6037 family protein (plasmid) [Bacillus thuringiensis]|nr:DUF6037 family protein [Bacillus thuringiensis]UYX55962.1 DUF6037 family protein [Bacillus thuringiensis]
MLAILGNLKDLKNDMEKKGWCIDSFLFKYKMQEFIVLVKLYINGKGPVKPKYALLQLEFLKKGNINDKLLVPANSASLLEDASTLRDYFGIDFGTDVGDAIQSFYRQLSLYIPTEVNTKKTTDQERAMVESLSNSDKDDPNKIYCYSVRRNSETKSGRFGERSPYNDNKARILRPTLYNKLKNDIHLSFNFSADPEKCEDNDTILHNWAKNKNI